MKGYALITGATSGIGLELARNFCRDKIPVILAARSEERLQELKRRLEESCGAVVVTVAVDLARDEGPEILYQAVKHLPVEFLVNNAGIGTFGRLANTAMADEVQLVKLNILALLKLTKLFVPAMVERQSGYILNVASMAAFMPGPVMANYYASKAYVLSLSEALHEELKIQGIKVTALCPGPVRTNFQERAGIQKKPSAKRFMLEAKAVADEGYAGLWKGKAVVVPGTFSKVMPALLGFLPRSLRRKAAWLSQKE